MNQLNFEKEHEVQKLSQPIKDLLDQVSQKLETFPKNPQRDDLIQSVNTLSYMIYGINTQPFRLHQSDELPQLEHLISSIIDFVTTRLNVIIAEINAMSAKKS